jgi:hypothetical protein
LKQIDKIASIIGDVGIPLMGVLWWNWSFYFILLYLLIDLLVRQIFINERLKLTILDDQEKRQFFQKNLILFLGEVAAVHVVVGFLTPSIDFAEEAWRFWAYKDMGIQQGPILIPAVFLMEYLRIRNERKLGFTGSFQIQAIREQNKMSIYRLLFYLASILVIFAIHPKESYVVYGFLAYLTIVNFIPLKDPGNSNV